MLFLLRLICGIRYRIKGIQHIPAVPSIILSKHQSAWETLAFQQIFPAQVWVLKKELLRCHFWLGSRLDQPDCHRSQLP